VDVDDIECRLLAIDEIFSMLERKGFGCGACNSGALLVGPGSRFSTQIGSEGLVTMLAGDDQLLQGLY